MPDGDLLPNRRACWIERVEWQNAKWLISVSLGLRGFAVELFIDPADERISIEPALLSLIHAGAITASRLLRSGESALSMAKRLERRDPDLLQIAFAAAARIEEAYGHHVRELEAWRAGQEKLSL